MKRVLVVDDSPCDQLEVAQVLEPHGTFCVDAAADLSAALAAIAQQPPDVLLVDPSLPNQEGLELVSQVRRDYPHIPVVLVSSKGNEEAAISALKNGAASYVPKHLLADELQTTLRDVLDVSHQRRCQMRMLDLMTEFQCRFVLENDRTLIPPLVGYLQEHVARLQICSEGEVTRVGIALDEALVNALYHGNLELDSKLREHDGAAFHELALARAEQPPYSTRRVCVEAKLTQQLAEFVIRDDGPGFDPTTLPDPTDPKNLDKVSGRGVLLMQTFMDQVEFSKKGNTVVMRKWRAN
jgi:DNA-binding response OmpR family regulator